MRNLLYEGKAKKIFKTDSKNEVIIYFTDNITSLNGKKKESIKSKGKINCHITKFIFNRLNENQITTHYIKDINENEFLAKKLNMINLEVVIRNIAAGSLVRRLGLKRGVVINASKPLVELYYKNDDYNDPIINDDHVFLLNILHDIDQLQSIKNLALRINDVLKQLFQRASLILVDFKLEFGFLPDGSIVLGDEISPDTCRLWDFETRKPLDKDVFRNGLGDLTDAYNEVYNRLLLI